MLPIVGALGAALLTGATTAVASVLLSNTPVNKTELKRALKNEYKSQVRSATIRGKRSF